ncbi:uncharacterized protein [Physcomitrium patens]|uniref:Glycosyltransferase 2-like domain-containing protein n=1 Tax=Physcomitrium patens TaxID=3218 RepID=A0A2K1IK63_PHYPA|nr:uncharacterized protein LOC112275851 [Physcomitrium patens]PNR29661.1 hypothetical protein PHYPA_028355 [Physcomitrium patens]|eukprot:XP_024362297.1 uncharacterized protein LOC112275851 [Physcomitrella patens]
MLLSGPTLVGRYTFVKLQPWAKSRGCVADEVLLQLPSFKKRRMQALSLKTTPSRKGVTQAVLEFASGPVSEESEPREEDKNSPAVSVIIPVYNEIAAIGTLVEKVGDVMQKRGGPYEVVCVDDGSTDGTARILKQMAAEREDMRVVIFRRNFGQTAAMAAGFDFAAGDVFVTMDGDLQNDAEDIPKLVDQLVYGNQGGHPVNTGVVREDGGYDLVCGWRRKRKDNAFTRNFPSWVANMLIGALTGVRLHDYGCSLKAYRAPLLSTLLLYGEMHRFIPTLAAMEGAAISELEVRHHPRTLGKSKYGLGRIFRVLMDLTTVYFLQRFRQKPMHFIGFLGGVCMLGSIVAAASTSRSLVKTAHVWGYSMAISSASPGFVLSLQLLIMGLQLVCLGLVAEVCVRIYYESQSQPVYRVREVATSTTR